MIEMVEQDDAVAAPSRDTFSAAARGEAEDVETVVRWAWPQAHRVAYLITHDRSASDDIAQEAIIAAVRALGSFDVGRDPRPWVERIAANKAIDWVRRRHPERELELVEDMFSEDTTLVDGLAESVNAALSADLMDAFGELSPAQRQAVLLRHLLDYEPSEIAEMLDIPAATVRTHIHRGLLRLRELLDERERSTA